MASAKAIHFEAIKAMVFFNQQINRFIDFSSLTQQILLADRVNVLFFFITHHFVIQLHQPPYEHPSNKTTRL